MKYKLLVFVICITIIRIHSKPTNDRTEPKLQRRHEFNKRLDRDHGIRSRIKVDKNGNRWTFDENSREWMHLPKQQINPITSPNIDINEPRGDDFLGQSLPSVFPSLTNQKGQQAPARIHSNSGSIYGPQFPSNVFQPMKKPVENYEPADINTLPNNNGPIYGPLQLPGVLEPTEEEDNNDMEDLMPWHNFNNISNNFPIPGGPNYPNHLVKPNSNKPITQNPVRNNGRDKPNTLEDFEDPFESDYKSTNKPNKVKKIGRMSTTPVSEDNDNYQPFPPSFAPHLGDEDIELEPIVTDEYDLEDNQVGQQPKHRPSRKPNRKPIIKIPIAPPEQPSLWTIVQNERSTTSTPIPTTENSEQNNSSDVIELFPPVPPEQPGNVYTESTKPSSTDKMNEVKQQDEVNNKPKEIVNPSTTITTTNEMTNAITSTTTATTEPKEPTVATIQTTTPLADPPTTVPNNPSEPIRPTTVDPWKPITLGKRHQTPVPIIEYPTLPPSAAEVWRPVMGPVMGSVMGSYSPIKVPTGLKPSVDQPIDSNWVRPAMGSMNGNIMDIFTTRKVVSTTTTKPTTTTTTTTTTMGSTPHKRKFIKKKIIRATTERTTTTTTETPKTTITQKNIKRQKRSTTTTTTTTTTERPTTILSTTLAATIAKRKVKKTKKPKITTTTSTTTTTEAPTETTEEEILEETENTDSEPIIDETEENDESNDQDQTPEPNSENEKTEEDTIDNDLASDQDQDQNNDSNSEITTDGTQEEGPKEVGDQNNGEEEEGIEEVDDSQEGNEEPTPPQNANETSETDEEEVVEEDDNSQESEEPTESTTSSVEYEYEEELEEAVSHQNTPQNIKQNIKEEKGTKNDNNSEEVVEYEYEEVTEDPDSEANETEEVIEEIDETPEVELITKETQKESDDNWEHIVIPMRRKIPPNLFPNGKQ